MSEYIVERFVRERDDKKGVGISQITKATGISEIEVDRILYKLHRQGRIRYAAAEQFGGEKRAFDIDVEEEPDEP